MNIEYAVLSKNQENVTNEDVGPSNLNAISDSNNIAEISAGAETSAGDETSAVDEKSAGVETNVVDKTAT